MVARRAGNRQESGALKAVPALIAERGGPMPGAPGIPQRTLKSPVHCAGVGTHGNGRVSMALRPAPPETGIVFRRIDRPADSPRMIGARHENVVDTTLCTTIGNGTVSVRTVEHLMAAFAGCGIDNAVVDIDGEEVPAMDGSAAPFVSLIECAGTVEQSAVRRAIEILKTMELREGSRAIGVVPAESFSIRCDVAFDHPALGRQSVVFDSLRDSFCDALAGARTFCMEADIAGIRAAGLGRGGSLENTIVVGADGVVNEGGLRYPDECARHKTLDCIGDLYLAGAPILGRVHCERPGHRLNHVFLAALLADRDAWRLTGPSTPSESAPVAATA